MWSQSLPDCLQRWAVFAKTHNNVVLWCKQLSAKISALLYLSFNTLLYTRLFVSDFSSPDIQRDRHHGVENDDVGPEGEEGREQEVVYRGVPGQVALKQGAHFSLPHCVTHSQDHTHTHQEAKDLTETHRWRNMTDRCPNV